MMKEFYSNGEEEKTVGYLTYDSREVTEGTLFICKGAAFKAEYLDAAIEKGAIAYVSEVKYETKEDYETNDGGYDGEVYELLYLKGNGPYIVITGCSE